jgi:hypothetical protein
VRFAETDFTLSPFTYCYSGAGGVCVDGFDSDPPSVGSPDELFVYVPVPGFDELTVSQSSGLDKCQTSINARTEALGGGWWVVRPRGSAGDYRVSIFASGNGGDMVADLLWKTPSDQAMPKAASQIAVIADHDGRPDSYGVELSVDSLATSPVQASAAITVTAANGRSLSFEATNPRIGCGRPARCGGMARPTRANSPRRWATSRSPCRSISPSILPQPWARPSRATSPPT